MKNTRFLFVLSIMAFLGNSLNGQAQNYLTQQSVQNFFYPQFSPINLDQGTDTIEQKALLKKFVSWQITVIFVSQTLQNLIKHILNT